MHDLLLQTIEAQVILTAREREIIKTYFEPRRLRRRSLLQQEGDIIQTYNFVQKGVLITCKEEKDGHQRILSFSFEGWWVGDLYSLFTREPTQLVVEALEDSLLLQLRANAIDELYSRVPAYERYMRIKYQNAYVALQRRLASSIGLSAEQRYKHLLEQQPRMATRVPQHLLASYLGISPETLSRIKARCAQE